MASLQALWQQRDEIWKQRNKVSGVTYVDITREEFEEWLSSTGIRWKIKDNTEGIYWLLLSDLVAIQVSSSLGRTDASMGYARASMQMRLISQVTKQVLNKKIQDQSHFKRTKNWRATLSKAVDRFKDEYVKVRAFYDAIAEIEDRKAYQAEFIAKIEAVPNWQEQKALTDFHGILSTGKILTQKQRELLEKLSKPARVTPAVVDVPQSRRRQDVNLPDAGLPDAGRADPEMLDRMRRLWFMAKEDDDKWTMDFVRSLGEQFKIRGRLSEKQLAVLEEKFRRYKAGRKFETHKLR
jgi:hypothetical protein